MDRHAFAGVLTFDASAFYIDWKDLQLTVLHAPSGRTFVSNASRAGSNPCDAGFAIFATMFMRGPYPRFETLATLLP